MINKNEDNTTQKKKTITTKELKHFNHGTGVERKRVPGAHHRCETM